MGKRITFRGALAPGLQDKINIRQKDGKTGYKITRFEQIQARPGTDSVELIGQIFTTDQTAAITSTIDFTDSDLLAINYYKAGASSSNPTTTQIIFDQEIVNQNLFVTIVDEAGGTQKGNYFIELEEVKLSDIQSTQLTLKSLRAIASR
jgi:archaellum component FlaF (FlaF/FlaG flagellin family)